MIPATIEEDVQNGLSKEISHRTLNEHIKLIYKKTGESIKIPNNSFISKYKEYFDNHIIEYPLSEKEQVRYRYSPKVVSQDIYSTTEYWSILLFINDAHSILDFNPTTIRYIDPTVMETLINEILILEGSEN